MEKQETKMWSYKMTHDAMMAPNPFFGMLTLATCKPLIRKSAKTKPGVWIAGWTACTTHNSPFAESKTSRCDMGKEKLIYLAKVSEVLPYEQYGEKYPQKRPVENADIHNATYYGDNYYYKENGEEKCAPNNQHHFEMIKEDWRGKNAVICQEFYYFTPENRLSAADFEDLIHKHVGAAMKQGVRVDEFIAYVKRCVIELGYSQGIVGTLPIHSDERMAGQTACNNTTSSCGRKKKGGCVK